MDDKAKFMMQVENARAKADGRRAPYPRVNEDELRECDCCGEMKRNTHTVRVPYAGDTVACEDCLP